MNLQPSRFPSAFAMTPAPLILTQPYGQSFSTLTSGLTFQPPGTAVQQEVLSILLRSSLTTNHTYITSICTCKPTTQKVGGHEKEVPGRA